MAKQSKKSMYLKEIAEEYGVSAETMRRWIRPLKNRFLAKNKAKRKIFIGKEVDIIHEHLGDNQDE
jgi:uncharacterized protein YjcR